jgi:hypothetical protein
MWYCMSMAMATKHVVLHVNGKSLNINALLICFLINVTFNTWKKWECKVFIHCCSLSCYRNRCTVYYTTLVLSHQNNQLLLVHDKRHLVSHWPAAFQFEILITTFVEPRVVAGRSRTWASRPRAATPRPMLIHKCHAMPTPRPFLLCRDLEKSLSQRCVRSIAGARRGHGMALVNWRWDGTQDTSLTECNSGKVQKLPIWN